MARRNKKNEHFEKVLFQNMKQGLSSSNSTNLWQYMRQVNLDQSRVLCGSMDELADRLMTMYGALDAPLTDFEVIDQFVAFHHWVSILKDEIDDMYDAANKLQKMQDVKFFDYWFNPKRAPFFHPVKGGRLPDSFIEGKRDCDSYLGPENGV